jgi:hypothetical protein
MQNAPSQQLFGVGGRRNGVYAVEVDELDSIWGDTRNDKSVQKNINHDTRFLAAPSSTGAENRFIPGRDNGVSANDNDDDDDDDDDDREFSCYGSRPQPQPTRSFNSGPPLMPRTNQSMMLGVSQHTDSFHSFSLNSSLPSQPSIQKTTATSAASLWGNDFDDEVDDEVEVKAVHGSYHTVSSSFAAPVAAGGRVNLNPRHSDEVSDQYYHNEEEPTSLRVFDHNATRLAQEHYKEDHGGAKSSAYTSSSDSGRISAAGQSWTGTVYSVQWILFYSFVATPFDHIAMMMSLLSRMR